METKLFYDTSINNHLLAERMPKRIRHPKNPKGRIKEKRRNIVEKRSPITLFSKNLNGDSIVLNQNQSNFLWTTSKNTLLDLCTNKSPKNLIKGDPSDYEPWSMLTKTQWDKKKPIILALLSAPNKQKTKLVKAEREGETVVVSIHSSLKPNAITAISMVI